MESPFPMRIRSSSRVPFILGSVLALAAVAAPATALAQEPLPAPAPPIAPPPQADAAPAAPAPAAAVPITASCALGEHPGIDEAEARTAADVICHEVVKRGEANVPYEVRFGKLGGKTLVILERREGDTYDERRTLLTSLEEVTVAAPRLAASLAEGRAFDETKTVDNVLASETRPPKVEAGQMGFDGGIFGMTGLGASAGASGGIHLGLLYRAGSFGVSTHGRAGGIGSTDDKLGTASLDIGARYYLSTSDVAPFVGGGLELAYFDLSRKSESDLDGSGFGAFGQLGMEFLRSHHAALSASVRVDAPFFELQGASKSKYVAPLSLNVGVVFH